jgi:serine protease Do
MEKNVVKQNRDDKPRRFFARTLDRRLDPVLVYMTAGVIAIAVLMAAAAAQARTAPTTFADLAAKLLPAVVNISTTQVIERRAGPELPQLPPGSPFEDFFREFFDRNQPQQQRKRRATSLGSGFIVDAKGYVVTNNHVIQDADEITVILQDNTRLKAEIVGRDAKTDIAVLRVKPTKDLPAVPFGDSDKSRVGDWVVAIGNPFGLGGTVTAGIISARGRDINSGPYDDFIQTDASINRGNSGGPMFNLDGRVIGINTAIYSPSGGSVGIGFAIPSAAAEPVIRQLIENGAVRRGWLGVHIQSVTEEIAETLGLEHAQGALVANVIKDGPAEKAKIKAGDVITRFDGKDVNEMRKLPRIVAETPVDKEVDVELWRENRKVTVKVTIARLQEEEAQVAAQTGGKKKPAKEQAFKELGLTLATISDSLKKRFDLDDDAKGVVVTKVEEQGAAAEKGIRPGDLIVEVSQQEVEIPADVLARIKEAREGGRKRVLLLLEGQRGLRFVPLKIDQD